MNPRQWLGAVVGTVFALWILSEVSLMVLPHLNPSAPFAGVGFGAVAIGEVAFVLLILALGGWGLYQWAVEEGFRSR